MSAGAGFPHSFRIRGAVFNPRKRVQAVAAFEAYRLCDPRACVEEESYLGVFQFGDDFAEHLARTRSPRGFAGGTWSRYVWWDIDRDAASGGVARAMVDAAQLIAVLETRYGVPPDLLLTFLSGGKGCHVGLPTELWRPAGGPRFHQVARRFAETVAAEAAVTIDTGIYDRVRAFRSPNSRHPETGLHKRFVPAQQLGTLTLEDAVLLAARPAPFDLPDVTAVGVMPELAAAWEAATKEVEAREAGFEERRRQVAAGNAEVRVNRLTLDLIRGEPITVGDRHRTIYSAARNLAEAGAPRHLVVELLREASLDTGLPPREVDRQIDCGVTAATAAAGPPAPAAAPASTPDELVRMQE